MNGGIAIVRRHQRDRAQELRLEPFSRRLPGFTLFALGGDLLEPAPGLRVDVGEVGEGS